MSGKPSRAIQRTKPQAAGATQVSRFGDSRVQRLRGQSFG